MKQGPKLLRLEELVDIYSRTAKTLYGFVCRRYQSCSDSRQRPSGPPSQADGLPHQPASLYASRGELNPCDAPDVSLKKETLQPFCLLFLAAGVVADGAESRGDR